MNYNYHLLLKFTPVFHVSLLKKKLRNKDKPILLNPEGGESEQPDSKRLVILQTRIVKCNNQATT